MNRQSFSSVESGYSIAAISFDETHITGTGGSFYPRLVLQARLDIHKLESPAVDHVFTELNAQFCAGDAGKFADSLPVKLQRVQRGHWASAFDEHISLEFLQ